MVKSYQIVRRREKLMEYKDIKDLNFKVTVTDYEDLIDDRYGNEYGWYEVPLKERMPLELKESKSLVRSLKEYSSLPDIEELREERIKVFDGDEYVGVVSIYMFDKIKSIYQFISLSEAKSGDAGVCACCIVNNGLFKSMVQNRRYAYIEWINLSEEYETTENEGLVLKNILEFLKRTYKVKRVFSRPVAIDLSDDEIKIMRTDYHQIEMNYYLEYGDYMVGYVRSYYKDADINKRYLWSLSKEKYNEIFSGYEEKRRKIQSIYEEHGMRLINSDFEGVMCAEL